MVLKSSKEKLHDKHHTSIFKTVREYNTSYNLEKGTFGVRGIKLLGFYLIERYIEANPKKYETIVNMATPPVKKEVMNLNGMLTTINKFIFRSTQHTLLFYKLLMM